MKVSTCLIWIGFSVAAVAVLAICFEGCDGVTQSSLASPTVQPPPVPIGVEQVKTFYGGTADVQGLVNPWLEENSETIEVIRVLQSQSDYYLTISIFYKRTT